MVPTRLRFSAVFGLVLVGALSLTPFVRNSFIEILGETLFVGTVLLAGYVLAGALRQTLLPRWVAQLLAVTLGAMVGPLIVQLLGTGGNLSAFLNSRPLVHDYFMVMFSAAICGSLVTLGALYRERHAQARAEALQ